MTKDLPMTRLRWMLVVCSLSILPGSRGLAAEGEVEPTALRGKIMCGYQGWFRCPGDAADMGWIHWSRDSRRFEPRTLTIEMWPDMSEYTESERFPAPGFTYPDGKPAALFSSDHPATVQRHFEWMRDYGIDGAWLQHFVVDLPGGPSQARYPSRRRVLDHVRNAAAKTGRVWALTFDISGMRNDRVFDLLTEEWKRLVDERITSGPRYLHDGGKPVVQIFGFYHNNASNAMTADLAARLIDFFKTPGPYSACLAGGGDWKWRRNPDPDWQKALGRLDAYSAWNIGNYSTDKSGTRHAAMSDWADDQRECQRRGVLWLPVVYPGFSWDNLQRKPSGSTAIPRNGGRFLWEQFHELTRLGADSVYIAMFDEVDEGTAIFKVTSSPPTQAHFLGYEGLPSDWYLRLIHEGGKMLRGQQPLRATIPIQP